MQTFHFREAKPPNDHIGQYNFIGDAQDSHDWFHGEAVDGHDWFIGVVRDGHDWFKLEPAVVESLREGNLDAHEIFMTTDDFLF